MKCLRRLAFVLCLAVFLTSGALFLRERARRTASRAYMAALRDAALQPVYPAPATTANPETAEAGAAAPCDAAEEQGLLQALPVPARERMEGPATFTVDFDALRAVNADVAAWIYCEDTPISYPIVHSSDNDDYLKHRLDGGYDAAGSLFIDCRNAADFSDRVTVVYGHNMKNDTMFGSLDKYQEQAYFEAHPALYLFTPTVDYRIELIAGFLTDSGSRLYDLPQDREAAADLVRTAASSSTFRSGAVWDGAAPLIVLSTCAYAYDSARYVLLGILVPQADGGG